MAESYVGEIRLVAGYTLPQNWLVCNGQAVSASDYPALYSLIGQQYGGNGSSIFNLPNLQGKLVAGVGQGLGLSAYTLGQNFGSYNVVLSEDQTAHSHGLQASTDQAVSTSPQNSVFAATSTNYAAYVPNNTGTTLRPLDPAMLDTQGSGLPHSNVMPCLAFNYIICVNGMYPTFD